MAQLGRYETITELSNKNAGSCKWCFATYGGQEYFIKEFLEPKHPSADTTSSPAKLARKQAECDAFEKNKSRTYRTINGFSDGNAVRITDFFRVGAKYYMAMPRIPDRGLSVQDIAALPMKDRCRLSAVIAHALACVHRGRYVHSDIKHTNILYTFADSGSLTAKLIDYDAGFFEDNPPRNAEEVAGDQTYFSPEACLVMMEEEAPLTCALDIFALGVLLHQYFTGNLPAFDDESFSCAGEAAACGQAVGVDASLPGRLRRLLQRMLDADYRARPTAQEVYAFFFEAICPDGTPDVVPAYFSGDLPGGSGMTGIRRL